MVKGKRVLSYLLVFVILAVSTALVPVRTAFAGTKILRLSGEDRYKTSLAIVKEGWVSAENAVLVTGTDFPDALCAAPLANKLNAPILLNEDKTLDKGLETKIRELGVKNVFIVGGEGVVTPAVETKLKGMGISVKRLSGIDRIKTSIAVANYMAEKFGIGTEMAVATGSDFPDALSIASIAAKKGMPIILLEKDILPEEVKAFKNEKKIAKSYIIGGTGVISDKAAIQLPGYERISGADRYETNLAVLKKFAADINFDITYLATGENFPDALSGSALAPRTSSPIVLVDQAYGKKTIEYVNTRYSSISQIHILGGDGVVPQTVINAVTAGKVNTRGNTLANLNNFGLAAIQDGWIYYSNQSDNQNLYKMKADGSSNKLLDGSGGISHINVIGDWIYYSGNNGELFKISTEGTGKKTLVNSEVYFVYATTDWIYYSSDALYKVKPDGSSPVKIMNVTDNLWQYFITDSYIYFTENGMLYRAALNGSGKTSIISEDVVAFNVEGNSIFYVNADLKLHKAGLDGKNRVRLIDGEVTSINASGNWIYYTNASDENRIYKVDMNGKNRTKVNNTPVYGDISIAGNIIFATKTEMKSEINRMSIDGTQKAAIGSGFGSSFKFADGWVYYVDISDNNIYKMKLDGTGKTSLKVQSFGEIGLSGGYVYYSNILDNNTLYRISTNGTDNKKVVNIPVNEVKISDGWIYFSNAADGDKLYKARLDGTGVIKLSDNNARNILIENNQVYYIKEGTEIYSDTVYRLNTDGTNESYVTSGYITSMQISDGNLYYHHITDFDNSIDMVGLIEPNNRLVTWSALAFSADKGFIYKVDGNDPTLITRYDIWGEAGNSRKDYRLDAPAYYIAVDSGWIYYETLNGDISLYSVTVDGKNEKTF